MIGEPQVVVVPDAEVVIVHGWWVGWSLKSTRELEEHRSSSLSRWTVVQQDG